MEDSERIGTIPVIWRCLMKTHETLAQQEFVARQLRRRQKVVLARLINFLSVLVHWEA